MLAPSLFRCPVVLDSLWPHGLQHTRHLCPSPSPEVCPSLCPLHWWCHPAVSSSGWMRWFVRYPDELCWTYKCVLGMELIPMWRTSCTGKALLQDLNLKVLGNFPKPHSWSALCVFIAWLTVFLLLACPFPCFNCWVKIPSSLPSLPSPRFYVLPGSHRILFLSPK